MQPTLVGLIVHSKKAYKNRSFLFCNQLQNSKVWFQHCVNHTRTGCNTKPLGKWLKEAWGGGGRRKGPFTYLLGCLSSGEHQKVHG